MRDKVSRNGVLKESRKCQGQRAGHDGVSAFGRRMRCGGDVYVSEAEDGDRFVMLCLGGAALDTAPGGR